MDPQEKSPRTPEDFRQLRLPAGGTECHPGSPRPRLAGDHQRLLRGRRETPQSQNLQRMKPNKLAPEIQSLTRAINTFSDELSMHSHPDFATEISLQTEIEHLRHDLRLLEIAS